MADSEKTPLVEKYDVVLIGAGISGVNAGYRIQTSLPKGTTYTILEARDDMGGTWDLFKYPGIRSDSDLHTFGFPWRPWREQKSIADGASIVKYIKETAHSEGIDQHIQFGHHVESAHWSTDQQTWRVDVDSKGQKKQVYGHFLLCCTGYYDYHQPLPTTIPGLENFKGTVVHPQFWPTDLDYTGKKVVVIGSGATAVTLLPSLADKAEHVTMLQRSPGYVISLPAVDRLDSWCRKWFPDWIAHRVTRWKFLLLPYLFYLFCRSYPERARAGLKKRTMPQLPENVPHDPHFNPSYNPWEQRMCVCPDGDFYKSLRTGTTSIATGHIENITADKITTKEGQEIPADIIVTATGLKLQFAGGTKMFVDNEEISLPSKFMWKGSLLQDVPNCGFCLGYTNASWTLGADSAALSFCRLINHMNSQHASSVVPRVPSDSQMKESSPLNLNSTYVKKGAAAMPKAGSEAPWRRRANYFSDFFNARFGDINTGLEYIHVST